MREYSVVLERDELLYEIDYTYARPTRASGWTLGDSAVIGIRKIEARYNKHTFPFQIPVKCLSHEVYENLTDAIIEQHEN